MRGRNILRGALMLPWLLPGVVVSFLWAWIFNDSYGVVKPRALDFRAPRGQHARHPHRRDGRGGHRQDLALVPLDHGRRPRGAADPAEPSRSRPPPSTAPRAPSGSVTSPCRTSPAPVTLVAVLEFIYNFGNFDTIIVMTGGGPGNSTTTLAVSLYDPRLRQLRTRQGLRHGRPLARPARDHHERIPVPQPTAWRSDAP